MADQMITLPDPRGHLGALLDAAVKVREHEPDATVVGGVAVICRLAKAHRITLDADALSRDEDLLTVLRARPDAAPADSERGVRLDDALVEVIQVHPVTVEEAATVDDPKARLFVSGHWWAYKTALPLTVVADSDDVERTLRVATPPALVATKTHAFVGRRDRAKEISDLHDLLLLVERFPVWDALQAAPGDMADLVRHFLQQRLSDGLERTRLLRRCQEAGVLGVTEQRLIQAFHPLIG